jgi:hypothetical protein
MSEGSALANGGYGGNGITPRNGGTESIFTKGIGRDAAARQVRVSGDADLGGQVLGMIAIVG